MARITYIPNRVIDTDGIADGASIDVYQAGTSTPISIYTDSALTVPAANPYVVGTGASVPALYHNYGGDIRLRIVSVSGTVQDFDPYPSFLTSTDVLTMGTVKAATRTELAAFTTPATKNNALLYESGREGHFVWSSANNSANVTADPGQGIYVAPASDATGASGAWVRKFSGAHSVRWFGATGDGATNDSVAVLRAVSYLNSKAQSGFGYSSSTPELFFPKGHYYMAGSTIELTYTMILTGEGSGQAGGAASLLRWDAGTTGIRTQRADTTGATGTQASVGHGGDGSIIRGLYLKGGFTTTEGEFYGIQLRATATIEDCFIELFQGDAIYVKATIGGGVGSEGACNLVQVNRVFTQTCRNGIYFEGADANAGTITSFSAIGCRQYGIFDKSFLGNTYVAPHVAACARVAFNAGGASNPASFVTQGGNRYVCVRGQEAGASTNAPTGAATNNTWWIYVGAGGADAPNGVVAWTNGFTFRAGGGYLTEGLSQTTSFLNPYGEIDQYSQFDQNTSILGNGYLQGHVKVSGGVVTANRLGSIGASLTGMRFNGSVEVNGSTVSKDPTNTFGPQTGAAADSEFQFYNTNVASVLKGYNWPAGTSKGEIWLSYTGINGNLYRANTKHRIDIGIAEVVGIDATGINMANGTGLLFNGTPLTATGTGRLLAAAFPVLTGDVTTPGGSLTTTIANDAVTYAKMQNVSATARLLGRMTAAAGDAEEIPVAGGLGFTAGTNLTINGAINAATSVTIAGAITSSSATAGIGYATGAGGTVTQITSKATGVTLNKTCGQITMNGAALAAAAKVSFVVSNTSCAAADIPHVAVISGGTANAYRADITAVAANSFTITVENITAGSLSEAPVIGFFIHKAVTA